MPDTTTHFTNAQKEKIKGEIINTDQTEIEVSCYILDVLKIINVQVNEVLPTIQQRLDQDVLRNWATC